MCLVTNFPQKYNASMNSYLQKSLHNLHVTNVYHTSEQNIILYNYMKSNLPEQLKYVQIDLTHTYSYENMPAKDQKSEFILGYIQKFIHFELLREVQQTDDQ